MEEHTNKMAESIQEAKGVPAGNETGKNSSISNPTLQVGRYPRMAGFWERFAAFLLDSLILGLAVGILAVIFGMPSWIFGSDNLRVFSIFSNIFVLLCVYISPLLYSTYFLTQKGATLGRMAMNIKVVQETSLKNLTIQKAIIRALMSFVSSIPLSLGYTWYFMSDKRQTWHDAVAGSYVVKTDGEGKVLMDGPSVYKEEPVGTFLPCGCYMLLTIASIAAFIAIGGYMASQFNSYRGNDIDTYNYEEFRKDFEKNEDLEFDPNYNPGDELIPEEIFPDEDGAEEKFNRMFEEMQKDLNSIPQYDPETNPVPDYEVN